MSASEIMPSQGTSTFDLFALRFICTAEAPVHFPPGETANLFRGQFGKLLYRRDPELYARFFAPVRESGVPSGLHDPPRPFVLRVRHLDGATLRSFEIGMNVFGPDCTVIVKIGEVMEQMAAESLKAELYGLKGQEMLRLPLDGSSAAENARIVFLSPTELKNQHQPKFGALFSRIRDRISALRGLYGAGPLEIDFKAMGERAASIRMTRCELNHVDAQRVSRAGQRHPLSGFTGIAEYEGDLTEFIPFLKIAQYTGVGRQTVWGKGEISVETF
jgi:hypothetical protein